MSAVEPLTSSSQQRREESRESGESPYEATAQTQRRIEEDDAYWEERRRALREEIKLEADHEEVIKKFYSRRDAIYRYYVTMFFTEVGVWIINIAVLGLAAAILAYLPPTSLLIAGSITLVTSTWQAVRPFCELTFEPRSGTDARPERHVMVYLVVTAILWAASTALMFGGYGIELVRDQRKAATIDKRSPLPLPLPLPKGGGGGGRGGRGGGGGGKPAWKGNLKKVGSSSLAGDAYVACGAVSFAIFLFALFQLWCAFKVYRIYRKEQRGETWA